MHPRCVCGILAPASVRTCPPSLPHASTPTPASWTAIHPPTHLYHSSHLRFFKSLRQQVTHGARNDKWDNAVNPAHMRPSDPSVNGDGVELVVIPPGPVLTSLSTLGTQPPSIFNRERRTHRTFHVRSKLREIADIVTRGSSGYVEKGHVGNALTFSHLGGL